jgi:hypothetical protein
MVRFVTSINKLAKNIDTTEVNMMKKFKTLLVATLAMGILGTVFVGSAFAATTQSSSKPGQVFLGNLATALNIDQATLVTDLQTAANQTVAQALQNGFITQQQATNLQSRISNGTLLTGMRHRMARRKLVKSLAKALGTAPKSVASALRGGTTVSALATAQNMTVAQVESTMLTNAGNYLSKAVTNGKMTQNRENAISAKLQQSINSGNWINWLQKSCSK